MHDLLFKPVAAQAILLLSFVIGAGLYLGKFKFKGVTLGSTWILFVGILVSHFGLVPDPGILHFVKEFGLILFVFSIGLQVGPGFFHSFRSGGVKMNLLAVMNILLAVAVAYAIAALSGEDVPTLVGVMSGAVTNTPGLGAAQQTVSDLSLSSGMSLPEAAAQTAQMASGYAVAYPFGVLGLILAVMLAKVLFKVDLKKEEKELLEEEDTGEQARRMHVRVENPAIFGKKLRDVLHEFGEKQFVVSRIMKGDEILFPDNETVLEEGDKLLLVITQDAVDKARILFGEEIPMHVGEWREKDHHMVVKRVTVTKSSLTGKKLRDLRLRSDYGITVTRIIRSGVELVARPGLYIQMGDGLICVGPEQGINRVADYVGNTNDALNRPNLVPIFLGIVLGVLLGSIPIRFPGVPQPVKLGLAGGPLIVAILLGHFGPKFKITTYTTVSANLMIREIGISLFLAAVGLGAGQDFVSSLTGGGYWWILYGAAIALIPPVITFLVGRYLCKLNFYKLMGLVIGSSTNPPVLAFAQEAYGTDYVPVNYATVYPLSMFMRVLVAQVMILIALA